MEFDKSRVYTAVNADELKVGSKVIVADALGTLFQVVVNWPENAEPRELSDILTSDHKDRFCIEGVGVWNLAYLVSEPEEKKLKWTDLKVGDIITNGEMTAMVVIISSKDYPHIFIGHRWIADVELAEWEKVENDF